MLKVLRTKVSGNLKNLEYQSGDVVNYNGSSYVALTTSLAGFQPPQYLGVATDPTAKWSISI